MITYFCNRNSEETVNYNLPSEIVNCENTAYNREYACFFLFLNLSIYVIKIKKIFCLLDTSETNFEG